MLKDLKDDYSKLLLFNLVLKPQTLKEIPIIYEKVAYFTIDIFYLTLRIKHYLFMEASSLQETLKHKDEVTYLQLYRQKLKEIPKEVFELKNLEELVLYDNSIKVIPPEIGKLKKLKKLSIERNNLKSLPNELFELKELEGLHLDNNPIKTIPAEIGQLKKLNSLDLYSCKLTELPIEIGDLSKLNRLSLNHNQLTKLPEEIGKLINLTDLTIDNNQLTELPEEIGNLTDLTRLCANQNQLTTLPNVFEKLTKLKSFYLYDNQLTNIPSSFEYLISCEFVSLFNNQLTEIPISLKNSPITELDLGWNQIEEITDNIAAFKQITKLELYDNPINYVSPEIKHLKKLKRITLSKGNLTELPNIFDHLENLEDLSLGETSLKSLPQTIYNHDTLKELSFNGSQFEKLPLEVLFIKNLKKLYEYGNIFPTLILEKRKAFATACNKKNISVEFKQVFYDMINQDEGNPHNFPLDYYFQALGINFLPLQQKALNFIRQNWEDKLQNHPIKRGSILTVLGKSGFNKKELKERLVKLDIEYTAKITAKTTHVILEKGVTKYENFDKEGLVFIPEVALQNFLDTADTLYLSEENVAEDEIENIQLLLSTLEEDTIMMGLEMLNSLGGAEKLVTELFLIVKNTNISTKVRNKAKKHLLLHTSEELKMRLVKHKSKIMIPSPKKKFYFNDWNLISNALSITSNTEVNRFRMFSYLLDHQYVKEISFCTSCLESEAEKILFLKKYLTNENRKEIERSYDLSDFPNSLKNK